jgi:hypothetical protein
MPSERRKTYISATVDQEIYRAILELRREHLNKGEEISKSRLIEELLYESPKIKQILEKKK